MVLGNAKVGLGDGSVPACDNTVDGVLVQAGLGGTVESSDGLLSDADSDKNDEALKELQKFKDRQFWINVILLGLIVSTLILVWMFNSNLYRTQIVVKRIWEFLPKIEGWLIS